MSSKHHDFDFNLLWKKNLQKTSFLKVCKAIHIYEGFVFLGGIEVNANLHHSGLSFGFVFVFVLEENENLHHSGLSFVFVFVFVLEENENLHHSGLSFVFVFVFVLEEKENLHPSGLSSVRRSERSSFPAALSTALCKIFLILSSSSSGRIILLLRPNVFSSSTLVRIVSKSVM